MTKSDVTKLVFPHFQLMIQPFHLQLDLKLKRTYTAKATDNRRLIHMVFQMLHFHLMEAIIIGPKIMEIIVLVILIFYDAAGISMTRHYTYRNKKYTQSPSISGFSANNDSIALNNSTTSASRTFTVTVTDNVAVSNVTVDGLTYGSRSGNNCFYKNIQFW